MIEFVDPRSNPQPPARVSREPSAHGEALRDLIQLCLAGRVYDVERWIRDALANKGYDAEHVELACRRVHEHLIAKVRETP